MLIYKLLGEESQDGFATSFGVSYGVGAVAEWQARGCACGLVSLTIAAHALIPSAAALAWLTDHAIAPPHLRIRKFSKRWAKDSSSWPSWSGYISRAQ
jgi:hypothetical protein